MISYIKGRVSLISENSAVLECAGIGYSLNMPSSSISRLEINQEACIYTTMSVREDGISLFGFVTPAEKAMFEMLITVSGIGPKGALGILSSLSVEELKLAISAEDSKLIASAKGVGNKTAQKIVLELKGKIDKEILPSVSGLPAGPLSQAKADSAAAAAAAEVLEALGFSRSSAVRAVNLAASEGMTSEDIINEALKIIE